jgi:dTDP-glucose 4,6-dehydratase
MRVLVTGGCGFIGSCFVRWVLAEHDDVAVTNLDALTYAADLRNVAAVADDPRYTFVKGDVTDASLLREVLAGHDAVVNFAAETHVDRSIESPDPFTFANVLGPNRLLSAAMDVGVERCLHVSTDEVYGPVVAPDRFSETDPLRPRSPYAASKAAADLLVHAYRETYGYPAMLTRPSNTFGPHQHPEKAVPLFVTSLLDGGTIPLYGSGENVRDWLHVEDNVSAHWTVLVSGEPGETYNVAAGNEMTNRDLALEIVDHLGRDEAAIEHVPDRPGHDLRYAVATDRIRALGWRPQRSFEDALAATIAWYRDNESWWRPLKEKGATARRGLLR